MFQEADNIAEFFRGFLPLVFFAVPILIIFSANPVLSSNEFSVQRMSQFDLNGVAYGCRSSAISFEAKSLYTWNTARHCVVAKMQDLTIDQFQEIRKKAGALIILLPGNVANMSMDEKEHLNLLEQAMITQSSPIPVYFIQYNTEFERIIDDVTVISSTDKSSDKSSPRGSALSELLNSVSANGYQVVISGASHAQNKNSRIPIIQGELVPGKLSKPHLETTSNNNAMDNKLPLIIITAHLNTFGLYNEYPLNADAAVLMTMIEMFSKLYNTPNTVPKYRLMFLLSESGAILNFQGIKKWLDESVQLQNVDFVLCLDSMAKALNVKATDSESDEVGSGDSAFYMHVSKPPKEGTAMHKFFTLLKEVGAENGKINVDNVHKKINLADQQLAWEHERFSIKRLPAFTLSALKSPKEPVRTTIFKENDEQILLEAQRNARIIVEALARYIYGIQSENIKGNMTAIFADGGSMSISKRLVKGFLHLKSALHNNDLKNSFEKYLKNVKIIYDKPDQREPDFMFYDGQEANLNVYRVKPAVFDLLLTILICMYLGVVYLVIQYFPQFYDFVAKFSKPQYAQSNGYAGSYSSSSQNNSSYHHNGDHIQRSKAKAY